VTGRDRAWALAGGFLSGSAGGLFGVGGGLVLIPVLTGIMGFSQHRAHGTSLAVIGPTALVSAAVYAMHGNIAYVTALLVAVASMFTARVGALLTTKLSPKRLARAFAVFLALVALRLLWKTPEPGTAAFHAGAVGVAFDLAVGALAGLVAGFMGVGGGIISVPAFTLALGMSQQLAQGTSLAAIVVAAPAGAIEHARHGHVAIKLVPWLALGAIVGGPLASWGVQGLPQAVLVRSFAVFLLVNAVITWTRAGSRGGGPKRSAGENPPRGVTRP
jgi:uncharacterized membrane protein YfcA